MAKTTAMEGGGGAVAARTKSNHRFGEVAGGTAAECAAICCCCPCTVVHLLVLTIFKVPVCLCRKAHERRRIVKKKKRQAALLGVGGGGESDIKKLEREVRAAVEKRQNVDLDNGGGDREMDGADDLENEMWDRFYSTGFWRSDSQKR